MKKVCNSFFVVFVTSLVFDLLLMTMKHFIVLVDFCDSLLFENCVAWSNEMLYMHIHETLLKGNIISCMLLDCNELNSIHKFLDHDVIHVHILSIWIWFLILNFH
jgi:hypothetical protein